MHPIESVCIVGPGAMGAYYFRKYQDARPGSVYLLAGGDRAKDLERKGLTVNDRSYRTPVKGPSEGGNGADLLIVAVKHHHLDQAIEDMQGHVGPDSLILSVMNGIDSEERLAEAFSWERVLYGVALGIDALRDGRRVSYTKEGTLYVGRAENTTEDQAVARLRRSLEEAGIPYEVPGDMLRVLWWKYMINVGVNQVSAVLRAPFGVFQTSEAAVGVMDRAMQEVIEVARAQGIRIGPEDVRTWHTVLAELSPDGKTSMCQDVEAGRKTEVEMFAGRLIELGRQAGVATPVNQTLMELIQALESRQ
jgi:2-dehydropantoate 2-reductase